MRCIGIIASMFSLLLVACGSSEDGASSAQGGAAGAGGQQPGGQAGSTPADAGSTDDSDAIACASGGALSQPIIEEPIAAFVTSDALAPSFARYAAVHAVLGIPTEVVTTSQICGGTCDDTDPTRDTAASIKQWIREHASLRYVILGGDVEHVPARRVHDRYQNPILVGYTFEQDIFTDYYYADLSDWDANGDGVYAEDGVDQPDYRPEVAISRITASNADEAARYLEKVRRYLTAYPKKDVNKALLLSNVATQFAGMDIDGAWYFEAEDKTLALLPEGSEVRKLYATGLAGAEKNSVAKQVDAMQSGYNLVVHSGHGTVHNLTSELSVWDDMSGEMAHGLKNDTYFIFLSSACEAGTFVEDDSAGELLMDAPDGGAIAYLGNAAVGLGLAGGMQMIDELLRYVQSTQRPLLADAVLAAHQNMPEHDTFRLPVGGFDVPVVDRNSYEWTQKSVTLLGDVLIPVWKEPMDAGPGVAVSAERTCEGALIHLQFGAPIDGTARVFVDASMFEVEVAQGTAVLHVPGAPSEATVGFELPGHLATLSEATLTF